MKQTVKPVRERKLDFRSDCCFAKAYSKVNAGKGYTHKRMVCSKCKKDCAYHEAMKFGITDPFHKDSNL